MFYEVYIGQCAKNLPSKTHIFLKSVDNMVELEYNINEPERFPCGDTLKLYSDWGG